MYAIWLFPGQKHSQQYKTTFSEVRHLNKGAGEGATKQKGSVCFQAKVYTVNAAEIARPGD